MLNEVKNYSGLNNNKKTCEWLCDSEREGVCVWESFRIHSSIFNVSCCTSVAMYQNAVTWHALLYIKKKEQAVSCPVFLYKCWLILGGRGGDLCLLSQCLLQLLQKHTISVSGVPNLIRLLMFQKECQFFCISAKAVQQCAHKLHVAKMITVTLRTEYSNSVFAVCHIQMNICITVCGGGVVCSSAAEEGWRRGNWQGSWKQFMLCVSDAGTWRKRGQLERAGKLSGWVRDWETHIL